MLTSRWFAGQAFRVLWELRAVSRDLKWGHQYYARLPLREGPPLLIAQTEARSTPILVSQRKFRLNSLSVMLSSHSAYLLAAIPGFGSATLKLSQKGCVKFKWVFKNSKHMSIYKPFRDNNRVPQFQTLGSHHSVSSGYVLWLMFNNSWLIFITDENTG